MPTKTSVLVFRTFAKGSGVCHPTHVSVWVRGGGIATTDPGWQWLRSNFAFGGACDSEPKEGIPGDRKGPS